MALREKEIEMKKNEQQDKVNQFQVNYGEPTANTAAGHATTTTSTAAAAEPKSSHDNGSTKPGHNVSVRKSNTKALNIYFFAFLICPGLNTIEIQFPHNKYHTVLTSKKSPEHKQFCEI